MTDIIILPGIGGSDERHWQTHWEKTHPNFRRFAPANWDKPDLRDWLASLDHAVSVCLEPPILVAHSLSCLLAAHWNETCRHPIAGAFLVAVPDPNGARFPAEARQFRSVPKRPLNFPALIIASSNDPFATLGYTRSLAADWGAALIEMGHLGHVNGNSNLGEWQEGLHLLNAFIAGTRWQGRLLMQQQSRAADAVSSRSSAALEPGPSR
jgi:hypothetical protein